MRNLEQPLDSDYLKRVLESEGTVNDTKYLDYSKPFARIFKSREALLESV